MSTVRRGGTVGLPSERVKARVARRVSGGGGTSAVGCVVGVLEVANELGATERNAGLVRVLASDRMANVASCLRRDLQADGVVISEMEQGLVGTANRRDVSAPSRSEVRGRAGDRAPPGVDFMCIAEAGSR